MTNSRNITWLFFVPQPLVVWGLPIRPLKGYLAQRLLAFYPTLFSILATTWDNYLLREGSFSDNETRLGVGIGLGAVTTLIIWFMSWLFRNDIPAVVMVKPTPAVPPPAPPPAAKSGKTGTAVGFPVLEAERRQLANYSVETTMHFSGATWLPVLLLSIAYNAATDRQYDMDHGLRAALYLGFFFLCMPLAIKPWITEHLLVPKAPAWDRFMTVVFEAALCLYLTQMMILHIRLAQRAEGSEDRWNDLPWWAGLVFVGFAAWRVCVYLWIHNGPWKQRKDCVCLPEAPTPSVKPTNPPLRTTATAGGSELRAVCIEQETTPLLPPSEPLSGPPPSEHMSPDSSLVMN